MSAESPGAWHFWVEHYEDREQAYRDSKYTYVRSDGSLYVGLDPPDGAEPYVFSHRSHLRCQFRPG